MAQLRQEYEMYVDRDTLVVAIGPENAESFKNYWEKNDLPFIGLPDEQKQVLNLFGQELKLLKLGRLPAQMLVDKKGIFRYVYYGNSMADIPSSEETLSLLDQLQKE